MLRVEKSEEKITMAENPTADASTCRLIAQDVNLLEHSGKIEYLSSP